MEFLLTAVAIVLIIYLYLTRNFNHWKNKNIPFVKPIPLFGNVMDGALMRRNMAEVIFGYYFETDHPVLGLFFFDRPCLLIKDLKIIKRVLVEDFRYFCDRGILNNKRDDPIGTCTLFTINNPEWKGIRSKISPVFTASKIKVMSTLMQEMTGELIDHLKQECRKNPVIEMKETSLKFVVNVVTSTVFGVNAFAFKEQSQYYIEARRIINYDYFMNGFRLMCYTFAQSIVKVFRMKLLNPVSVAFLNESFLHILHERSISKSRRNDLIDLLLDLKNSNQDFIDDNILVSQAVVFFVAGTETSSSTLALTLFEMALHPEVQTKLRNEITETIEKHGRLSYEAIHEMTYLDMCLKEVLRKYPALPFLERQCNTTYAIPEIGAAIDANTSIFVSTYALHYDPKYFPDPEAFDPNRFSPENQHNIPAFCYLPFGQGPRNCIGARYATVVLRFAISSVLTNFLVEPCSETKEKIKFHPRGLTLAPESGIKLKFLPLRN